MAESTELILQRPKHEIDSLLRIDSSVKSALDVGVRRAERWQSLSFLNTGRNFQYYVVAKTVGLLTSFSEIEPVESYDEYEKDNLEFIKASTLSQLEKIKNSFEQGRRLAHLKTEGLLWDYIPNRFRNSAMNYIAGKFVLNAYGIQPIDVQDAFVQDINQSEVA